MATAETIWYHMVDPPRIFRYNMATGESQASSDGGVTWWASEAARREIFEYVHTDLEPITEAQARELYPDLDTSWPGKPGVRPVYPPPKMRNLT